jgi:LysR family nod box-dependent transcriptional activator
MARFDLNLLSALHALLQEKNVTRAAEKLHVTQPTMSGMLQRLRFQFDDELLVRNGRLMELTPFADSLCEPVGEALRSVDLLVNAEPIFDPATSKRQFTMMASDYCTSQFLQHVIAYVAQKAPGVRILVQPINAPLEKLIAGDIDLCVSTDDFSLLSRSGVDEKLQTERLFSEEFVCVVDERHELGEGSRLDELLGFPHVGVLMPGTVNTIDMVSLCHAAPGYVPQYVVPDFYLVAPMVANTKIVGIIQRRLARTAALSHPIRFFRPPFQMPTLNEAIIWHSRHNGDRGHLWLRSVLADVAARHMDAGVAEAPPIKTGAPRLKVVH